MVKLFFLTNRKSWNHLCQLGYRSVQETYIFLRGHVSLNFILCRTILYVDIGRDGLCDQNNFINSFCYFAVAWSNYGEIRKFTDTSNAVLGLPNLGDLNTTFPDFKTVALRKAFTVTYFVNFSIFIKVTVCWWNFFSPVVRTCSPELQNVFH